MMTALLVGMAVAFSDSSARPITLAEALTMAQENAPSAIQARGQVRTTSAGVRSAYGAFLPNLSFSAGSSRQLPAQQGRTITDASGQQVTLSSEPWSFNAGVSANVELFTGGRRFLDLRQAKARSSAAEYNEVAQRYDLALTVKQQFFDILAEREAEAAARAQLETATQSQVDAVARVRALVATRSDSLRTEIQVRSARLAIMDAENALATAEATLSRTIGSTELVTASPADTVDPAPVLISDEELFALANQSPNVTEAEKALDAAKAARKAAWTDYLPSVSMSYSRSGSKSSSHFAPTSSDLEYNGSVRFSLSFPIFNQFQREAQVVQAKVAEDNAVAALRDAQLAARQGMTQVLGAYRTADDRLESQRLTVAAAEEDLRVQQARYKVGGSTFLDVLTSQSQLDQARRDLIRARYDRRVARAQLEALVGRDL
jgi:outer membrane protein